MKETQLRSDALSLLQTARDNHLWRQTRCVNLIPSENTASRAVRLLCAADPSFRYAEHKKLSESSDTETFYYQGTDMIGRVERLLVEQMRAYLGCAEVETRALSGQMANTITFSALMDWKNRGRKGETPQRLRRVLHNNIMKGGHLSAQPMGALHDYIDVDPVTGKSAVRSFPVCADDPYRIDVEKTGELIAEYRPEFLIFGKSMVLRREPVREIRAILDAQGVDAVVMYDMAHVLGLVGEHFQNPFAEGADIVTGSTHKTFFGPQRGVIGVNYSKTDENYGLWRAVERRTFPGSVSNHHLGTQLGLLMAAYEMNAFKDEYQRAVVENAKNLARSLHDEGFFVAGDPDIGYTETHQVILEVGAGRGPELAERLEKNNIIVNYQATPNEASFSTASGLRMGVSEMTRFGFEAQDFARLAKLMADCILRDRDVSAEVAALRAEHLQMRWCFDDAELSGTLDAFLGELGL